MPDYSKILEELTFAAEDMAQDIDDEGEVKAGARHSGSDNKLIQAIRDAGEDICELAEALGATPTDEAEEEADAGDMGESVGHEGAPVEGKSVRYEIPGHGFAVLDVRGPVDALTYYNKFEGEWLPLKAVDTTPRLAAPVEGKSVDLEGKIQRIRQAWYEAYPPPEPPAIEYRPPSGDSPPWLVTVLDDGVVVEQKGALYQIAYTVQDGKITFAGKGDWQAVQHGYVAVKAFDDSTKGIELVGDDLAVVPGYNVKALDDGTGLVGGYLIRFGGDGDLSKWRDVFTADTDFGTHTKTDVWTHHRMLPGIGKKRLTNQADIGIDDEGVFIKHLLNLRNGYEAKLYELAQKSKLGWSSGTAPHTCERKAIGDGRHEITLWNLGIDASYTPVPAGGFDVNTTAIKSLFDDAEIDLLAAVYEEAEPEAKTADDRARRLLIELDLLALEAA